MVGSVLFERMTAENDFEYIEPHFFSESKAGQPGPEINGETGAFEDATDINELGEMDVMLTTQGSDFTVKTHSKLRESGWQGYWIDAASNLRYDDNSVLVLDPINKDHIDQQLAQGKKDLIGANCTTATMLIGLGGLFKAGLVEWAHPSTSQAISGAGAQAIAEMLAQAKNVPYDPNNPGDSLLNAEAKARSYLEGDEIIREVFGAPISMNLIPWIDSPVDGGKTREEWKAGEETRKILDDDRIIVDGICTRIDALRSHSQNVFLKLKEDLPLDKIEEIIKNGNEWVQFVPNEEDETKSKLTPLAVSGSLKVAVGRVRKNDVSPLHLDTYVVGDQLLWGAAEPLRRALKIVLER